MRHTHATQITLDTRDIFIECTATDLTKAKVVLNTSECDVV
jgi:phenylalanyl-tRNA synthetase beta chain